MTEIRRGTGSIARCADPLRRDKLNHVEAFLRAVGEIKGPVRLAGKQRTIPGCIGHPEKRFTAGVDQMASRRRNSQWTVRKRGSKHRGRRAIEFSTAAVKSPIFAIGGNGMPFPSSARAGAKASAPKIASIPKGLNSSASSRCFKDDLNLHILHRVRIAQRGLDTDFIPTVQFDLGHRNDSSEGS